MRVRFLKLGGADKSPQEVELIRANQAKTRARKKAPAIPLPSYVEQGGVLLDAMSNAMRLIALEELSKGEQPVGQISAILGLSQSATSQHLRILKRAGLLTSRRRSQSVFYACRSPAALAVLEAVLTLFPLAATPEPSPEIFDGGLLTPDALPGAQ